MKIDGRQIAAGILENLKPEVTKLINAGITPTLAIILIGNNASSKSYIKQKELKAKEIGVKIQLLHLESSSQAKLLHIIKDLNNDSGVHGIIIQRPLTLEINKEIISKSVDPKKDVDGFNPESDFDAPVAEAVIEILKNIGQVNLPDKKIVVIGKGETAGGPVIKFLNKQGVNPTVVDSLAKNPESLEKQADILISAVGRENVLSNAVLTPKMVLIGVGLFMGSDGKLHGDYKDEEVEGKVAYYTPTLGGVGPVNVACLLENLIKAAESSLSKS